MSVCDSVDSTTMGLLSNFPVCSIAQTLSPAPVIFDYCNIYYCTLVGLCVTSQRKQVTAVNKKLVAAVLKFSSTGAKTKKKNSCTALSVQCNLVFVKQVQYIRWCFIVFIGFSFKRYLREILVGK